MVLDASLLNTQHYKVRIKGKVEPSREGVAPSPTSWCSSYRSLRVTLDYGRQLYLLKLRRGFSQLSFVYVLFSFNILSLISVLCHHLNPPPHPLTITVRQNFGTSGCPCRIRLLPDCEMVRSPDTIGVLLTRLSAMVLSTAVAIHVF